MKFAAINGLTLHYATEGEGDMTLVFVNSLGTELRLWDEVAPHLAAHCRLVRYDKRGHGLSDTPPGPYSIRDHSADLLGLLDHLAIPAAVVVGISVGGVIALDFAHAHPQRVQALVLCDTAAVVGSPTFWNERVQALEAKGLAPLAEGILARWFTPTFSRHHPAAYHGYRNMLNRTPLEGYIATCLALRDADLSTTVAGVTARSLVLCGTEDISTPPAVVRQLAATLANSEFDIIPDAGHLPPVEQPALLAARIERFLQSLSGPAPLGGFSMRRPALDDAEAVLEMMIAGNMADYGEVDSDLNDLLAEWQEIDLEQDAWLVTTAGGQLAGYAMTMERAPQRFLLDYYAHPAVETDELISLLLALPEPRIAALAGTAPVTVSVIVPGVKRRDPPLLEAAGYHIGKYYYRMLQTMDDPPGPPAWPDGLLLRNARPGEDDETLFHFINTAFDWPGRGAPPTFTQWRDYMMRPDHFLPELWFLVFDEEELIGAALCYDYHEYGWVRQLAVRKDWRGRGLGSTLLRHVFGVFYERGHRQVALGLEANNLNALAFYERVGMKMVRRYDEYQKTLPGAPAVPAERA